MKKILDACCGRESVSRMTMIDGKMICADYVEKIGVISDKGDRS